MTKKYEEVRNQIVVKAWKDPSFKKKLQSNPKEALKECGVSLPENVNVKVVEDNVDTLTLAIPAPPKDVKELSEQALSKIAGGFATPNSTPMC